LVAQVTSSCFSGLLRSKCSGFWGEKQFGRLPVQEQAAFASTQSYVDNSSSVSGSFYISNWFSFFDMTVV
jgi:hypothetical protein